MEIRAWRNHTSVRSSSLWIALLALALFACATGRTTLPQPKLEASALVGPTVGRVIPVFVEVRCVGGCEGLTDSEQPFITRSDVSAINVKGQVVSALSVDDAVSQAGSAVELADAASKTSGATVVAQAAGGSAGATMAGAVLAGLSATDPLAGAAVIAVGVPLGVVVGLGYGAYLAANQEARATLELESDALPDITVQNPKSPLFNRGWVFFPAGKFSEVRFSVFQAAAKTMRSVGELNIKWVERPVAQAPTRSSASQAAQ